MSERCLPPRRRVAGGGASGAPAEARIYRAASIAGFDEFQGDDEDCGALVGCGSVVVPCRHKSPGRVSMSRLASCNCGQRSLVGGVGDSPKMNGWFYTRTV